jgi:hypothetical protein
MADDSIILLIEFFYVVADGYGQIDRKFKFLEPQELQVLQYFVENFHSLAIRKKI